MSEDQASQEPEAPRRKSRHHLDSGYARPDLNFQGGKRDKMLKKGLAGARQAINEAAERDAAVEKPAPVSHAAATNMNHTAGHRPQPAPVEPTLIEEPAGDAVSESGEDTSELDG